MVMEALMLVSFNACIDKLNTDHRTNNTGIRFYQRYSVSFVDDTDRLRMDAVFGTWWSGVTAAEGVIRRP